MQNTDIFRLLMCVFLSFVVKIFGIEIDHITFSQFLSFDFVYLNLFVEFFILNFKYCHLAQNFILKSCDTISVLKIWFGSYYWFLQCYMFF